MPEAQTPTRVAASDDESLVILARRGDRTACEELFQRHRGVAYRVAYRLLGHEQDALDAVQDGCVKAFVGLIDFDGRSGFRTWLVRIVSNAAIDLGRKRGRRAVLGTGVGSDPTGRRGNGDHREANSILETSTDDDPAKGLLRDDLRRALDSAIARLSPTLRITFVLFAEAGLSYKEIAEAQNVPIGTVMSRLHAAKEKMQAFPEIMSLNPNQPE